MKLNFTPAVYGSESQQEHRAMDAQKIARCIRCKAYTSLPITHTPLLPTQLYPFPFPSSPPFPSVLFASGLCPLPPAGPPIGLVTLLILGLLIPA